MKYIKCGSIECDGEIGLETSPVDRIHVVGGAFVHARVHLSGWIDFDFGLDTIIADTPFVHLRPRKTPISIEKMYQKLLLHLHACTYVGKSPNRPSAT